MSIKAINTTLLVITVIGLVFSYRAGQEYRQVLAAHRQLDTMVGLPIQDPSKVHVRAIATGEDLFFSWRVYVPAGMSLNLRDNLSGDRQWRSPNTGPDVFFSQVQLIGKWGVLEVGNTERNGFHNRFLHGQGLPALLRSHWDEIQVEQLGADGLAVVEVDELATLLRLTLPDDLKLEFDRESDSSQRKCLQKALLLLEFGSDEAFQNAEADQ